MGTTYKGFYEPTLGEVGWDVAVNGNFHRTAERLQQVKKTIDETAASSSAMQDADELFAFLGTTTFYEITGSYIIDNNGISGPTVTLGVTVPAGTTVRWGLASAFTGSGTLLTESGTLVVTPGTIAAGLNVVRCIYQVETTSTTGNFQVRWTPTTSSAVVTSFRKWSRLKVEGWTLA